MNVIREATTQVTNQLSPTAILENLTAFSLQYNTLTFALGTVVGLTLSDLIKAISDDLFSPILLAAFGQDWKAHVTNIGPIAFRTGHFAATLIQIVLVMLVISFLMNSVFKFDVATRKAQEALLQQEKEEEKEWRQQMLRKQ